MAERITDYPTFWLFYLGEHRRPATRALHLVGTLLGLGLAAAAIRDHSGPLALGALVAAYGLAWISHFFVEHNTPATFRYPLWSLISDFRMLALALTFSLGAELRRAGVSP